MNYAQARQQEKTGRWDWTIRNDADIWTAPCCRGHRPQLEGHPTQEDAERCFWEYEIANARPVVIVDEDADTLDRCLVCSTFTASSVKLTDGYTRFRLCPDHHDRASLEQVHPFVTGRQLMYS